MTWPITLALTLAGVTTNHDISAVSFDRANLVTYVESGTTYVCTKAAYEFSGPPWTVRLVAPVCFRDSVFTSGFEVQ